MFVSVFFFFQAEDGIRDYKVTGVQTCALPISPPIQETTWLRWNSCRSGARSQPVSAARSEERRVGKECRSRGSPDHEKKKQADLRRQNYFHVINAMEHEYDLVIRGL